MDCPATMYNSLSLEEKNLSGSRTRSPTLYVFLYHWISLLSLLSPRKSVRALFYLQFINKGVHSFSLSLSTNSPILLLGNTERLRVARSRRCRKRGIGLSVWLLVELLQLALGQANQQAPIIETHYVEKDCEVIFNCAECDFGLLRTNAECAVTGFLQITKCTHYNEQDPDDFFYVQKYDQCAEADQHWMNSSQKFLLALVISFLACNYGLIKYKERIEELWYSRMRK